MVHRVPALFFILIANIVLLANIAIPHHHHNSEVCFVSTHCQSDDETHKHGTTEHKHEHDGESTSDYCYMNQVFVVPSNQVKQENKCLDCTDNRDNYNQFQINLPDLKLISFVPIFLSNAKPPLIFLSYTHFVSSSLGLRAPPIV
ncbi:MAG: hypothetical protein K8R68_11865 [Bacteroidales bacterium]|nr:hypothetical protein [Bacteroidales bacterium]